MRNRVLAILAIMALSMTLGLAQARQSDVARHRLELAGAPQSAHARLNPYEGKPEAVLAGRKLFERHCAECHGVDAHGRDKAPALDSGLVEKTPPGDLFWFITNGNLWRGMPSWSGLPDARRWQIVTYLKSLRE